MTCPPIHWSPELRGHGATDEFRKSGFTERHVLLDLHDVQRVASALGLDRDYVLAAPRVDSDVELVGLHLADVGHRRPEVVLERVARDAQEDVDEPVVAHSGQQGLLVSEGVHRNDARCGIRHLRERHLVVWGEPNRPRQDEAVSTPSCTSDDPLVALGGGSLDGLGQRPSIPRAVDDVADVARGRNATLLGGCRDIEPLEIDPCHTLLEPGNEDLLDDGGVGVRFGHGRRPLQHVGRQPGQRSRTTSSRSCCLLAVAIRVRNRSMAVSS